MIMRGGDHDWSYDSCLWEGLIGGNYRYVVVVVVVVVAIGGGVSRW